MNAQESLVHLKLQAARWAEEKAKGDLEFSKPNRGKTVSADEAEQAILSFVRRAAMQVVGDLHMHAHLKL